MIFDVVCIIGTNLVNLSSRYLLCALVSREIGLYVIEIVGFFLLSLFDECMFRAFF